ncbi:hypothetical protein EV359DRAFT_86319 [Lentinula novae-zelandiae]|nr:hypothetical protein EV359DRAFT_86319 [Lentinula novae-zelandiae]
MDPLCSYIEMLDIKATPIPESSIELRKQNTLSQPDYFGVNGDPNHETPDPTSSPNWNLSLTHSHLGFTDLHSIFDRQPTEIIIMIFSFLDFSEANILEINEGPWALARVCRRWRGIVYDCSLFWLHANLDLSSWHFTRNWPSRADLLVSTFLEKSRGLPLNVRIQWPDIEGATNHILDAVEHILKTSLRWKSAVLDLHYAVYHKLSSVIDGRFPQLESLMLKCNLPPKISRNSLPLIEAFQVAPKLRQVSIEGMPYATKNVKLPWNQLTHLNAYHEHPNPNYHCLRLSSNLVECHIGAHCDLLQSPRGPYSSVSLPHLKTLFVKGTGALVLPYVSAPNTEVLHVTDTPSAACSEACIEALQYFIQGCSESLKDLALHSDPLDYRLAEILYSVRRLVRLHLHLTLPRGSSLFKDLMKWLSYRRVPESSSTTSLTVDLLGLLPVLKSLSMRIDPSLADSESLDEMDLTVLIKMLESRRTMPRISEAHRDFGELNSFDLEIKSYSHGTGFDGFDALNEIGLKTSVRLIRWSRVSWE